MADVGVAYHDTTRRFTAGFVIKKAGAQFVKYDFEYSLITIRLSVTSLMCVKLRSSLIFRVTISMAFSSLALPS